MWRRNKLYSILLVTVATLPWICMPLLEAERFKYISSVTGKDNHWSVAEKKMHVINNHISNYNCFVHGIMTHRACYGS